MKRVIIVLISVLALLAGYLLLWPSPIDPVVWTPPRDIGPGSPTGTLADATRVDVSGLGPEDLEVDPDGNIYAGLDGGDLIRFSPSGERTVLANTGGRPLGLHWDDQGRLLIADAYSGLMRLQAGALETLATECGGEKLVFTDDLETTRDGRVWFTDASTRFGQREWKLDIMESRPNGRLCVWDPATKVATIVLDGLHFANGVAVDPEEQFLLVNETSRYRVQKVWIAGPKAGQHEVLIEILPGFPDGISTGTGGIFWIAIPNPRNPIVDKLADQPLLRDIVMKLPDFLRPQPVKTARLLGVDENGRIVHDLFDPAGTKISFVTSVQERGGRLYLGSLRDGAFAHLPRPGGHSQ